MDKSILASSVTSHDAINVTELLGSISHHGVKGMKWGVRRSESSGGTSSSDSHVSADAKAASAAETKIMNNGGPHALSNHELQGLITRMNLERQYHTMAVQNKSQMDKGLQATQKLLKAGKTVEDVRKFLRTPTGKALSGGLKIGVAYFSGGTSAAAGAGAGLAVRRMSNHYTNGPQ